MRYVMNSGSFHVEALRTEKARKPAVESLVRGIRRPRGEVGHEQWVIPCTGTEDRKGTETNSGKSGTRDLEAER